MKPEDSGNARAEWYACNSRHLAGLRIEANVINFLGERGQRCWNHCGECTLELATLSASDQNERLP